MPGLADLVPAQVQASSVGAVTNPNVDVSSLGTLPEFKDFMDAYKQGVITAEDIKRRQVVGDTGYQAERAKNVADTAVAEQIQLDASEVRPLQRTLAKAQAEGGIEQQTVLNQINSTDPAVAIPAQQSFFKRMRQKEAISVFGTAEPKLEVNQEVKPASFEDWAAQQVNSYRPGDNSPEASADRARYSESLARTGKETPEYKLYVKETKARTRPLQPGTPEYDDELRRVLHEKLTHEKLQEIQLETLKEFGKAQAKAVGEAPVKQAEAQTVAAKDLRTSFNGVKEIDDFAKVNNAYQQIVTMTDPNSKPDPIKDQGIVFAWMKILDPTSAVRETEYANVKNAKGVPDQIRNMWNQVVDGQILTPTQRQQLRGASESVLKAHTPTERIKQYIELEERAGLSPGTVVPVGYRELVSGAAPAPAASAAAVSVSVSRPTVEQKAAAPTYPSLAAVPANVQFFKGTDGQLRVNPNFKP